MQVYFFQRYPKLKVGYFFGYDNIGKGYSKW